MRYIGHHSWKKFLQTMVAGYSIVTAIAASQDIHESKSINQFLWKVGIDMLILFVPAAIIIAVFCITQFLSRNE